MIFVISSPFLHIHKNFILQKYPYSISRHYICHPIFVILRRLIFKKVLRIFIDLKIIIQKSDVWVSDSDDIFSSKITFIKYCKIHKKKKENYSPIILSYNPENT